MSIAGGWTADRYGPSYSMLGMTVIENDLPRHVVNGRSLMWVG